MGVPFERSRRFFLTGRNVRAAPPVRPPWSKPEAFEDACTRCGACIDACPEAIIVRGDGGFPELSFAAGACTFCAACAHACPEPLFDPDGGEPAFGHVIAVSDACLAERGVVCQSCGDVCPERAIRFHLRRGGPPLPVVDETTCTGCGACVATCPVGAIAPRPARSLERVDNGYG